MVVKIVSGLTEFHSLCLSCVSALDPSGRGYKEAIGSPWTQWSWWGKWRTNGSRLMWLCWKRSLSVWCNKDWIRSDRWVPISNGEMPSSSVLEGAPEEAAEQAAKAALYHDANLEKNQPCQPSLSLDEVHRREKHRRSWHKTFVSYNALELSGLDSPRIDVWIDWSLAGKVPMVLIENICEIPNLSVSRSKLPRQRLLRHNLTQAMQQLWRCILNWPCLLTNLAFSLILILTPFYTLRLPFQRAKSRPCTIWSWSSNIPSLFTILDHHGTRENVCCWDFGSFQLSFPNF